MIGYLSGTIIDVREQSVVVHTGGVGYEVFASSRTPFLIGTPAEFWIVTIMRENTLELFGFVDKIEHDLFKKLITISGVGPRTGLNILDIAPVEHIVRAVKNNDASILIKVSGIGKKTAEKIVLELRDKLDAFESQVSTQNSDDHDFVEALLSLGYSQIQARTALTTISSEITDFNQRIKEELRLLS